LIWWWQDIDRGTAFSTKSCAFIKLEPTLRTVHTSPHNSQNDQFLKDTGSLVTPLIYSIIQITPIKEQAQENADDI
jgi:hypothetical protein